MFWRNHFSNRDMDQVLCSVIITSHSLSFFFFIENIKLTIIMMLFNCALVYGENLTLRSENYRMCLEKKQKSKIKPCHSERYIIIQIFLVCFVFEIQKGMSKLTLHIWLHITSRILVQHNICLIINVWCFWPCFGSALITI